MDKEELMRHIEARDEIGEAYARMQMNFIKWAAKRALKDK